MVARDDSVIRGSLIASLVILVLSFALNIFLWQWGGSQADTADRAKEQLSSTQQTLRVLQSKADLMKAMLGVGGSTEAEREELIRSVGGEEDMQAIIAQYQTDMAYFGQEVAPQDQNYPKLPEFLVSSIRSNNEILAKARQDVDKAQENAKRDVDNARSAQKVAEDAAEKAANDLADAQQKFAEERKAMKAQTEATADKLTKKSRELLAATDAAKVAEDEFNKKVAQLTATIESQRQELNRLRSDRFESFQGEVTSVRGRNGGNVVMINLGAADQLRPNVTFGVLDGDATRPEEADVKATIRVTRIRDSHLASANVVSRAGIASPIVEGDKIYSPFWAPGRNVKIALVGDIDIDGDGEPDNEAVKAQIRAAGAEVVETQVVNGQVKNLDNSVRFLVEGTRTELGDVNADLADVQEMNNEKVQQLENEGILIAAAQEMGVTVIPAWKLNAYLRTIDDSLTTPLGSAARGSDFQPETNTFQTRSLPSIYKQQEEALERGNQVRIRP
ncbi:hypothetical protein [Crateriforma spongiae]|uniref:hypothetical protein n=1 Tax=Crateriforma spongiae TaxID=2724528 RepID=UPI001445F36D|nr:hypothetical protein [Crateriforma spongiae]